MAFRLMGDKGVVMSNFTQLLFHGIKYEDGFATNISIHSTSTVSLVRDYCLLVQAKVERASDIYKKSMPSLYIRNVVNSASLPGSNVHVCNSVQDL